MDYMTEQKFSLKSYSINVLNIMAQGLFVSLIIALIFKQIGEKIRL
jgi:uncharacterized membrane protein